MNSRKISPGVLATVILLIGASALAQGVTLPPSGDNQHSIVTQFIGPVKVTIDYNSPNVHGPNGEDRAGKIWGQLVPWGLADLGFGTCKQCPWRAGANQNTVFTVSHDVIIEGQKLSAGSYGLHIIPVKDADWTLIFSKNSTSWGSFFYDPAEDALRVNAKPATSEYHEWLSYEFTDRDTDHATVALKWENLQLPWTIKVPQLAELYTSEISKDLRTNIGFEASAWSAAANYVLQQKIHPDLALNWADQAVNNRFFGQETFTNLATLARAQEANGKTTEAKAMMDRAVNHPTANVTQVHLYGRRLLTEGKKEEALKVFELNAKKHPNQWPVSVGLMRGYAAVGKNKEALKHAKLAAAQAPDDENRNNLNRLVKLLEEGKPID